MKVSTKKDNPLIVSCSKSVLEDFHLQKIVIFSCKKDNSLIGL